jgi:large subunit ribosomal protein L21
MYAVVEVGGKQYKVSVGDFIDTEKMSAKKKASDLTLDKVLLVSGKGQFEVGKPYLKTAKVVAEVVRQFKSPKVISFKYRRRKSSHWKKGHRQQLTRLKIKEIQIR